MALISQLFGHSAINAAVRVLSATFVAMTVLLEPVVAAVAAAFVFGERPAPFTAVGALLILVAIGSRCVRRVRTRLVLERIVDQTDRHRDVAPGSEIVGRR